MYVDPDRNGLEKLTIYEDTLSQERNNEKTEREARTIAYNTARSASNFFAHFFLIMACVERKNILHGTTATSPFVKNIYVRLKHLGYKIDLHLLSVIGLEDRQNAILYREERTGVVQASPGDIRQKAGMIFERMLDGSYLDFADAISILLQPKNFYSSSGAKPKTVIRLVKDITVSTWNVESMGEEDTIVEFTSMINNEIPSKKEEIINNFQLPSLVMEESPGMKV